MPKQWKQIPIASQEGELAPEPGYESEYESELESYKPTKVFASGAYGVVRALRASSGAHPYVVKHSTELKPLIDQYTKLREEYDKLASAEERDNLLPELKKLYSGIMTIQEEAVYNLDGYKAVYGDKFQFSLFYNEEEDYRLVMPFFPGMTIEQLLNSEIRGYRAYVFFKLLEELSRIHEEVGLIHGDISWKNMMFDWRTNTAYFIDFGLHAKIGSPATTLTKPDVQWAPERIQLSKKSKKSKPVIATPAMDVYSIGHCLKLITNKQIFAVPGLNAIIDLAMSENPEARPSLYDIQVYLMVEYFFETLLDKSVIKFNSLKQSIDFLREGSTIRSILESILNNQQIQEILIQLTQQQLLSRPMLNRMLSNAELFFANEFAQNVIMQESQKPGFTREELFALLNRPPLKEVQVRPRAVPAFFSKPRTAPDSAMDEEEMPIAKRVRGKTVQKVSGM